MTQKWDWIKTSEYWPQETEYVLGYYLGPLGLHSKYDSNEMVEVEVVYYDAETGEWEDAVKHSEVFVPDYWAHIDWDTPREMRLRERELQEAA